MGRSSRAPVSNTPKPLPLVPGPKLPPFTRTAGATIEFIQELGNPDQDLDGLVWKVKIGGKEPYYALKMVKLPWRLDWKIARDSFHFLTVLF